MTSQQSSVMAWRRRAQGAAAATVLLILVGAALHGATYQSSTSVEDTETLNEIAAHQANWQANANETDLRNLKVTFH